MLIGLTYVARETIKEPGGPGGLGRAALDERRVVVLYMSHGGSMEGEREKVREVGPGPVRLAAHCQMERKPTDIRTWWETIPVPESRNKLLFAQKPFDIKKSFQPDWSVFRAASIFTQSLIRDCTK